MGWKDVVESGYWNGGRRVTAYGRNLGSGRGSGQWRRRVGVLNVYGLCKCASPAPTRGFTRTYPMYKVQCSQPVSLVVHFLVIKEPISLGSVKSLA
jgi:hypothetical protein